MKGSEIITIVRRELKETAPAFWTDAELLSHINRAERDYINKTRIHEDKAMLSLEIGRIDYPLPANWLSARLVIHNEPNSDGTENWHRVEATNLEKTAQENPNFLRADVGAQSTPRKYFIWGTTLYVLPASKTTSDSNLFLWYKAKPITLLTVNDPINLDDSLSEAIVAYVLWKAWLKKEERSNAAEAKEEYLNYILEGRKWVKKKAMDERKSIDIVSPVAFSLHTPSIGFNPLNQ